MNYTVIDNKLYLGLDSKYVIEPGVYAIEPGDVLEYSNSDQVVEVLNIDEYNIKLKVLFDVNIPTGTEVETEVSIGFFLRHLFRLNRVTDPEKRIKELTVKYIIN
jgi:hypothetical protein